jgi:cyclophilin family peptidyl-prolyl cis-trans isomerase
VKGKDPSADMLIYNGMAHLYLSEFDEAAEMARKAAKTGSPTTPTAAAYQKNCADYAGFWAKEQEIRELEASSDDLPRVVLKTSKGNIVLELFENEAPNTVANFVSLVEKKFYDGIKVHRVEPNFVVQAGDPNTRDDDPRNDGQGGPGYTIACECYTEKARKHFQGSLSMAHAGRDTGGSQFFITQSPTPHLNWMKGKEQSNHTVFGRVLKGLDVALALQIGDTIDSAGVIRKRDHAYVPKKVAEKPTATKKGSPKKKSDE